MKKLYFVLFILSLLVLTAPICTAMKVKAPKKSTSRRITKNPVSLQQWRIASSKPSREILRATFEEPKMQNFLSDGRSLSPSAFANRTLSLTRQFIRETNRFPRTAVYKHGKKIPSKTYTPEQKFEVALGWQLRRLADSHSTPAEIRQEIQNLKQDFYSSRTSLEPRVLENLNDWIDTHQSWPKEYKFPRTQDEIYETALARVADDITRNGSYSSSAQLVENIRQVRLFYDRSYFQDTRTLLGKLNDWLAIHETWPRREIIHEDPLEPLTKEERNEMHFAREVFQLGEGKIPAGLPADLVIQIQQVREYYAPSYQITTKGTRESSEKAPMFTPQSTQALLKDLEQWVTKQNRWPREKIYDRQDLFLSRENPLQELEEMELANRVSLFVRHAHPFKPNVWLEVPAFTDARSVLHTGTPYLGNPSLEQVRKLYYYARYMENFKTKHLPANYYELFKNWYYELEDLFPHNPYKWVKLPQ